MSIFPEFERDLHAAAARVLQDWGEAVSAAPANTALRSRRASRTIRLWMPIALSLVVAAAIAVVAIGALHGSGGGGRTNVTPGAPTLPVGVARARLLRSISVLRRPQSPNRTDRSFVQAGLANVYRQTHIPPCRPTRPGACPKQPFLARWGYPRADASLWRAVTVPGTSTQVLFAPTTYEPSPRSPARSEGINFVISHRCSGGSNGCSAGTGPEPVAVSTFLTRGVALVDLGTSGGSFLQVVAVPDGVARVALGPAAPESPASPYGGSQAALAQGVARIHGSVQVTDNLAAFHFRVITLPPGRGNASAPSQGSELTVAAPMTWYAADGSVVRRTSITLYAPVAVRRGGSSHS